MTGLVLCAPILVPLLTAGLALLGGRSVRVQASVGIAGSVLGLAAAVLVAAQVVAGGTWAVQVGGWAAPFGISLVADPLAAIMVVLTWLVGAAAALYALGEDVGDRIAAGLYPLLHVLLAGVSLSFLTGDLFNLYVGFEVMLMSSFVLLAGGGRRDELEGGVAYVALNLVSSALFLAAVGLLYGLAHTLNMIDLGARLPALAAANPALITAVAFMLLIAFGIKAAVFPLFAWLPASYHTPPVTVSAVFAGLLTKVGVVAMLRVLATVFPDVAGVRGILLGVATLTMLSGVAGAVAHYHVRRVLSWHIVSQIGYIVMGVALACGGGPAARLALTATVFYIAHHILVKTNLFLIGGVMARIGGSEELKDSGGLARAAPWLAVLFAVPAASLAGVPPLSGFWAKLAVIRAGLEGGAWLAVVAALVAGLLTLVSMVKIWTEAFWKPAPSPQAGAGARGSAPMVGAIVVLALLTVGIGLAPGPLLELAARAADALMDPAATGAALGLGGGAP